MSTVSRSRWGEDPRPRCIDRGWSSSLVKEAVRVLRAEGLVVGQQGKGVFVRDAEAPVDEIAELRSAVQDLSVRLARVEEQLSTSTERP